MCDGGTTILRNKAHPCRLTYTSARVDLFVVKCENLRNKPDGPNSKCGRAISHVFDLDDKAYTAYCPACKAYIKIEIKKGIPSLTSVDKESLDFSRPLACFINGQMVKL
jgi:hypothetical protein